jgi:uncharacterized protein YuzE
VTYSTEADALYLTLRDGTAAETIEIEEMVYLDIDADGQPLGIEFVSGTDFLSFLQRHGGEFAIPTRITNPAELRAAG